MNLFQVKLDIAELEQLQKQASRKRVIDIISLEVRKLGTELIKLQDEKLNEPAPSQSNGQQAKRAEPKHYEVKLNGYGNFHFMRDGLHSSLKHSGHRPFARSPMFTLFPSI